MNDVSCPECNSENVYFSKKNEIYICEDCEHRFQPKEKEDTQSKKKTLQLFLSYGHDSNEEMVRLIKNELEKRGHSIWIDKKEIKSGQDWRQSIQDGILKSESVLAFLSRHSVRDPGVCRDELRIALCKDAVIKTVLLENESDVSVPASVANVQWLDMQEWKEYKNTDHWEEWYQEKVDELFRVIESKENITFAGELEEIKKVFSPSTSDSKEKKLNEQDFVGREWISQRLDEWRKHDPSSKLLAMFGGPGTGKSRFVANELHYNPNILCSVFCEWDKQEFNNAKSIVIQLIFKLSCKLSDYRKKLLDKIEDWKSGEISKSIDELSAMSLMDEYLIHPLSSTIDGGREVQYIVIDGLDEADENGENILIDVITRCMDNLPPWIKFVVTSRPEKSILSILDNYNPRILNIECVENDEDIINYLKACLHQELKEHGNEDTVLKSILQKSDGAFLYINFFIQGVKDKSISLSDESSFPKGLGGFYMKNFQRKFKNMTEYRNIRDYFELITASQNLPVKVLLEVLNKDNYDLIEFENACGSLVKKSVQEFNFLDHKLQVMNLHHKSLADWLNSSASGKYFIDRKKGGQVLSQFARKTIGEDRTISIDGADEIKAYCKHSICDSYCIAELWDELIIFLFEKETNLLPYWLSIENIPPTNDGQIILGLEERIGKSLDDLKKDNLSPFIEVLRLFEEISQQRYVSVFIDRVADAKLDTYLQNSSSNTNKQNDIFDPEKIDIAYSLSVFLNNCIKNGINLLPETRNKLENLKLSALYKNGKINGKSPDEIYISDLYPLSHNYPHLLNNNHCNIDFGIEKDTNISKHSNLDSFFNVLCFAYEISNGINYVNINILKTRGVDTKYAVQLALQLSETSAEKGSELDMSFIYSNIAKMYLNVGDFKQSLEWYLKVLSIQEMVLGKDHLDTAATYESIAYVNNECGNYEEAFGWYEKALKTIKKQLGDEHPKIGSIYHNIGKLVGDQGREDLAIDWDLKALRIREKYLGKDHPETANTYNNLGYSYEYLGEYDKALEMNLKSLEAKKKSLRKDHPHIGMTYASLASVYEKQGKYEESLELYLKALRIREKALGKKHPFTARTYTSLGKIYRLCGDYESALSYLEKALEIRVAVYGEEHAETAVVYYRMGKVFFEQKKFKKALEMYKLSLAIREKTLEKNNTDIAKNLNDIALVLSIIGDYENASGLFDRAYNMQKQLFGSEHIFCADILMNVAYYYQLQNERTKALQLYKDALRIKERSLGSDHAQTLIIQEKIDKIT